jgi:hypothetical protein
MESHLVSQADPLNHSLLENTGLVALGETRRIISIIKKESITFTAKISDAG